jgi:hypothetical protein
VYFCPARCHALMPHCERRRKGKAAGHDFIVPSSGPAMKIGLRGSSSSAVCSGSASR